MRTEEEIKAELDKILSIRDTQPNFGEANYGNSTMETLFAIKRVEKGARIELLRWVLGAERE